MANLTLAQRKQRLGYLAHAYTYFDMLYTQGALLGILAVSVYYVEKFGLFPAFFSTRAPKKNQIKSFRQAVQVH